MPISRNARDYKLIFVGLVLLVTAVAARKWVGELLFQSLKERLAREMTVAVIGRNPRWNGWTVVVDDVLVHHGFANTTIEIGARRAYLGLSLQTVRFEQPIVDLISGSDARTPPLMDVGILNDVKGGELTVRFGAGRLNIDANHIDFRTRDKDGRVMFWFRDSHIHFENPRTDSLDEANGAFGSGTVYSQYMLLSSVDGRIKPSEKKLLVDPLTVRLSPRTEITGSLTATSVTSGFVYQFRTSQPQTVEVFDALTATAWHGRSAADFSAIPSQIEDSHDEFPVDLEVRLRGSNLESLTGSGTITVKAGVVPPLPVADGIARVLGAMDSGARHQGGEVTFDVSTAGIDLHPGVLKAEHVELCVGGWVGFGPESFTNVWALAQMDIGLMKSVRASKEILDKLRVGTNRFVVPLVMCGSITHRFCGRGSGSDPRIYLPSESLERGSSRDTIFFDVIGSLRTCWKDAPN